ncbi:sodium/proline symporter [Candidatus Dependentiae bacterium]|nr:sodium/proline symporter [Candidatus Dependentiae bacterium]
MFIVLGFIIYFTVVFLIGYLAHKNQALSSSPESSSGFILGNRSVNYWLTALSAQASDMSDWLFMALPAMIFTGGLFNAWVAIGLVSGMFASWHFIAPKLRTITEQLNCFTLSSYFEKRFNDQSGILRTLSALMTLFFFIVYICAGLTGIGLLVESALNINYAYGVIGASIMVAIYTIVGGFVAVAWFDAFQAIFLLCALFLTASSALIIVGGWPMLPIAAATQGVSLSLLSDYSWTTLLNALFIGLSWGLGYFGVPHVLTKFMAINDVREMHKAKYIGIAWQIMALSVAVSIGVIGMAYFSQGIINPELIFIRMVVDMFSPLAAGLILCAIVGATLATVEAQVIVVASVFTEDFYHQTLKNPTKKALEWAFRTCIFFVTIAACCLALLKLHSIQQLVGYAWMGLGSSFGPVVLLSLYSKSINRYGACAGILGGGIIAALWENYLKSLITISGLSIPALIPGFAISVVLIYGVSFLTKDSN